MEDRHISASIAYDFKSRLYQGMPLSRNSMIVLCNLTRFYQSIDGIIQQEAPSLVANRSPCFQFSGSAMILKHKRLAR